MKLALMQPYFFPYIGYFDLIHCADLFVVFDEAQHIRRGWINRNRTLHPTRGWQYINVPLCKAPRDTRIKDIRIHNEAPWKTKLLNQLEHYQTQAPYFDETKALVQSSVQSTTDLISVLNTQILINVCRHLGISRSFKVLSKLDIDLVDIHSPSDWAIRVCKELGADHYLNLPGGRDIYEEAEFKRQGLEISFLDFHRVEYECGTYEFIEGLSIIDVLMWNGVERTTNYLMQA